MKTSLNSRHLLLLLLVLSLASWGFNRSKQYTLSGQVTTCEDRLPLGYGKVTLYQKGEFCQITTADEDGCYLFSGVEPGFYTLTYTYYNQVVYKKEIETRGYRTHDFCVYESELNCR